MNYDGIPVDGEVGNYFYCTYEWPGVMEPSRPATPSNEEFPSYGLINPSDTCSFNITTQRYSTTDVSPQ